MRNLFSNIKGSVLPLVAVGAMVMVSAGGTAIDMGRAQLVQAKLSSALDAAGLAAGASVSTANVATEARKYFDLNFPAGYMGSTVTAFSATPNTDNSQIALSATATMPTTFMKIISMNSLTLNASTNIVRANRGLELALVLDVTGSMNCPVSGSCASTSTEQPNSKIAALRAAGGQLLDILYGNKTTIDNLWIGIVPFSQAVNVGTSRSNWTTNTTLNWGITSWNGCVTARWQNGNDLTETPPSTALFDKYYNPCVSGNGWFGTNGGRSNCSTGSGWQYRSNPSTTSHGPNLGCPRALTPMGKSKATTLAAINALTANGATAIPLGLAWGWRMLSPQWRGQWGGTMNTDQLPLDYKTPLMNKALILMTDGNNDISFNNYTAYGFPNDGGLGGTNACNPSNGNCTNGETVLNNRTSALCTSMKASDKDIIIYTIAFGSGISTATQTMLRNCASKPEFFFASPTTASLQTAFRQIGDSLANLRISQ